ncbi:MAG TPA: hypothetical protein VGD14_08185 [bacterium]
MKIKRALVIGIVSGLFMGLALFIGGAIFSRIIYGPQFAPPGKFRPEQINAFYFIWTKLVIGVFFGIFFTLFYEMLPIAKRVQGFFQGLIHGFLFWLVINTWSISHPLVYGSIKNKDQLFWLLYSLIGFLAYGAVAGYLYKRKQSKV